MSDMEPDVKSFLVKIINSLAIGLIWLMVNTTIGIAFNFAFFNDKPRLGNYIFYAWFLISLFFLLRYYKKKWDL